MSPSSWEGLSFTPVGEERLQEVKHFLLEELPLMEGATPEVIGAIRSEFLEQMDYLNGYGGDRYRVSLSRDWAPYSFSLAWMCLTNRASTRSSLQRRTHLPRGRRDLHGLADPPVVGCAYVKPKRPFEGVVAE